MPITVAECKRLVKIARRALKGTGIKLSVRNVTKGALKNFPAWACAESKTIVFNVAQINESWVYKSSDEFTSAICHEIGHHIDHAIRGDVNEWPKSLLDGMAAEFRADKIGYIIQKELFPGYKHHNGYRTVKSQKKYAAYAKVPFTGFIRDRRFAFVNDDGTPIQLGDAKTLLDKLSTKE